jgi:4-amino-4-deoxy-L-arabinose transferase-like glycosyltransferase
MLLDSTSTLAEQATAVPSLPPAKRTGAARVPRTVEVALLLIAAAFFALHFVHLRADFPNHSPWMDWAKYTDEGWYGDAAMRHYQLGHWYVPGDFNPAAALPVWPLLELALFRVTGVSVAVARALTVVVFGLTLACVYLLMRRLPGMWRAQRDQPEGAGAGTTLAPAIAVLLLAVSPFCYAFTRLAILEPPLILATLAALLAASAAGAAQASSQARGDDVRKRAKRRGDAWAAALGLLLALMLLTKTTGVFLLPAIFWMLWASGGYRVKSFLRGWLLAGGVGAAVWSGYYGLFVRPRYLLDYRYLFSANGYTGVTPATLGSVLHDTLFDGVWIGATLFWVALAAAVGSLAVLCARRLRANPLVVALLLWVLGYAAFLAYHDNLQPRYYLVLAVPLTMLAAIGFDATRAVAMGASSRLRGVGTGARLLRLAAAIGGGALVFAGVNGARQTIYYVAHPEYTFLSAANRVHDEVEREARGVAGHSPLLLSISGSDISLMTGLSSICDDFGTMTLSDRLAVYKPGWFASWNYVEDDKMEALAPMYHVVRVASFPAFDDPDRNLLILYRLDLVGLPARSVVGRRRSLSVPRRLRTKLGEQPTAKQLSH